MTVPSGAAWRAAGLSAEEVRARLERYGANALPAAPREAAWHRWLRQFRSPLIYILLVALAIDVAVWVVDGGRGVPFEGVAIAVILLLNAGLGVWQERKAEDALAKLKQLSAPRVWVLRGGDLVQCESAELVPGDVVRLEAGDRVPADARLASGENVQLDESVLTGESLPVDKSGQEELFAGTLVVRGKGYVEVVRTGAHSAMGRLATMLGQIEVEPTPLERRLTAFGHRVARWVLGVALLVGAGGLAAEGLQHFGHMFLFAVALAVAVVPEGLPAVLTVTLALGVERMARRRAVVRKLAAVEALGSVTVIATDKTGTVTENRMDVRDVDAPDEPAALRAMVLASDAELGVDAGDPLERALYAYAARAGVDVAALRDGARRVSSRSFDSTRKYMRATCQDRGGALVSYLKGAPELMIARCDMTDAERASWSEKVDAYAQQGFRLLALAWGAGEVEDGLTWLGLVLLWDPPRPEVPHAVRRAQHAGVRIMMITGDHPATALTVARSVGLGPSVLLTGDELDRLSDTELAHVVTHVNVFARVSPEHKLRIVEALKAKGEIVAMTGDGVNDAAALKRADVGVAMGQRGSDVTREVADLVLLDDNFATIVAAVEEGRSIYENVQKFVRFLFSTNLSEVLVVALGAIAAFALGLRAEGGELLLPLTAAQLLWINLVTDGAPALALGLDRNPGVMNRLPRNPAAPLLDRPSVRFIVLSGTMKALVALAMLGALPWLFAQPVDVTRTATFLFMAAGQLLFAYPARHTDLQPLPNPLVHAAVGAGLVAQALVVWVPLMMVAFATVLLPPIVWLWVGVSVVLAWGGAEFLRWVIWSRRA